MMVTLLVPTKNRPDFLVRLLRYYKNLAFQGNIFIGDSSEPPHADRIKATIRALEGKLKILYKEFPGFDNARCTNSLLQLVSTPYVALLPDDDLLVPRSLERCARFLENNSSYKAAHGIGVVFCLESSGPCGLIRELGGYRQYPVEADSAAKRLVDYFSRYFVTLFSVHRTETMRVMYRHASAAADKSFGLEILPSCLSVTQGKIKELDCLSLVRQYHSDRFPHPDAFDWVTNPNWLPSYEVFRECVAREVAQQDGIGLDEARALIKRAFWAYMARGLQNKWQARYAQNGHSVPSRWRELAKRVPGLRKAWHIIRSLPSSTDHEMSLKSLLRPSSPYHADFMPVYKAITEPTGESELGHA